MRKLRVRAFCLPKAGNQVREYEDACAFNRERTRWAVADGASDAFESRLWAQVLVQAFVRQPPTPNNMQDWLRSPIQAWEARIHWESLPWYAEEKARRGAFSTLLGVEFKVQKEQWWAMAVGDACLFWICQDALVACFPMKKAADFDTTPPLLSSRLANNERGLRSLQVCGGQYSPGDIFVVATDAFAAWFLGEVEAGNRPWQWCRDLTKAQFCELIPELRQSGQMRNDDVTVVIGQVES